MNDSIYCYDKERDEFLKQFSFVVEEELHEYIRYYNGDRIKTRLGGMSPVRYRKEYQRNHNGAI